MFVVVIVAEVVEEEEDDRMAKYILGGRFGNNTNGAVDRTCR
jgi:hypothetical protein